MYKAYLKFTSVVAKVLGVLTLVFLVSMTLACFAQVCIRNMGQSAPEVEEIARYSQVWLTFLGGALAYKHGSLAAVELLKNSMKGKAVAVLDLLIWALCVVFFYFMITGGFSLSIKMGRQITPALKLSKAYIYGALPVGGCFMMLFSFEHLLKGIEDLFAKTKKEEV